MDKKIQIHEFDPIIYPLKLWVVKKPTKEVIDEWFISTNDMPLNIIFTESAKASTFDKVIVNKKTSMYGVLVLLHEKVTIKDISHEATHASRFMWDWLNEEYTGREADAYLVGWIAQCIDEVKRIR